MILNNTPRLKDNALIDLLSGMRLLPIYILPKHENENATSFIMEGLRELASKIETLGGELYVFRGDVKDVLMELLSAANFSSVAYSKKTGKEGAQMRKDMEDIGKMFNVKILEARNPTNIFDVDKINCDKALGSFSAFFKEAKKQTLTEHAPSPMKFLKIKFHSKLLHFVRLTAFFDSYFYNKKLKTKGHGGEKALEHLLSNGMEKEALEDFTKSPELLSGYLNFGFLSAKAVYLAALSKLGEGCAFTKHLLARDFSYYCSTDERFYKHMKKSEDALASLQGKKSEALTKWLKGSCGVPLLDAGMKELKESGSVHNRIKTLSACHLIKETDAWAGGEQQFKRYAADYCSVLSTADWTNCATKKNLQKMKCSVQNKKFDPECTYTKRWLFSTRNLTAEEIHRKNESG